MDSKPHSERIEKALADLPIRYELSPQDQWLLAEAQTELRGLVEQLEAVRELVQTNERSSVVAKERIRDVLGISNPAKRSS